MAARRYIMTAGQPGRRSKRKTRMAGDVVLPPGTAARLARSPGSGSSRCLFSSGPTGVRRKPATAGWGAGQRPALRILHRSSSQANLSPMLRHGTVVSAKSARSACRGDRAPDWKRRVKGGARRGRDRRRRAGHQGRVVEVARFPAKTIGRPERHAARTVTGDVLPAGQPSAAPPNRPLTAQRDPGARQPADPSGVWCRITLTSDQLCAAMSYGRGCGTGRVAGGEVLRVAAAHG